MGGPDSTRCSRDGLQDESSYIDLSVQFSNHFFSVYIAFSFLFLACSVMANDWLLVCFPDRDTERIIALGQQVRCLCINLCSWIRTMLRVQRNLVRNFRGKWGNDNTGYTMGLISLQRIKTWWSSVTGSLQCFCLEFCWWYSHFWLKSRFNCTLLLSSFCLSSLGSLIV